MKQRFKNPDFNKIYWNYFNLDDSTVQKILNHVGSNRDQAFRDGYVNFRCKYQRNWVLYPIYVAGKERRMKDDKAKTNLKNSFNLEERIKMFLFSRWISTLYADEHLDKNMIHQSYSAFFDETTAMSVLNREDGNWWKEKLDFFEKEIYPNLLKNKSVEDAKTFLK